MDKPKKKREKVRRRNLEKPEIARRNQESQPLNQNGQNHPRPSENNIRKKRWIIGSVVLAAIIVGSLIVISVTKNKKSEPSGSPLQPIQTNLKDVHSINPQDTKTDEKFKRKIEPLTPHSNYHDLLSIDHFNLEKYPFIAGVMQIKDDRVEFGCHATEVDFRPYKEDMIFMTAAHCNDNPEFSKIHQIYFYDKLKNKMVVYNSDRFEVIPYKHFKYGDHAHSYDVNLIVIKDQTSSSHAVKLPKKGEILPDNFLRLKFLKGSKKYRTFIEETNVKLVNWNDCIANFEKFKNFKISDRFCAYNGVNFSAVGNSGSSLLKWNGQNYVIYGVYSAGATDGFIGPDIYMKTDSLSETVAKFNLF